MSETDNAALGKSFRSFLTLEGPLGPDEFAAAATAALAYWEGVVAGAWGRALRLLPMDLHPKAEILIQSAEASGVRRWVSLCLEARPAIGAPAELRRWCLFCFRVLRAARDHPQEWDCYLDGERADGDEALLLGGPLVLVWREYTDEDVAGWVTRFCHATFRRRGWLAYAADAGDYTRMIRLVWDHIRELGAGWPPEPDSPRTSDDAEKALAVAVGWCDKQAGDQERPAPPTPAPDRRAAAEPDRPEWSEPGGPLHWATVFGVSYKTMKRWLDDQTIRNQKLSPRRYRVSKDELP